MRRRGNKKTGQQVTSSRKCYRGAGVRAKLCHHCPRLTPVAPVVAEKGQSQDTNNNCLDGVVRFLCFKGKAGWLTVVVKIVEVNELVIFLFIIHGDAFFLALIIPETAANVRPHAPVLSNR